MKRYSISRLKTYDTCSQFYKHKYIDNIKVEERSYYTCLGSLIHKVLEDYYRGGMESNPLDIYLKDVNKYINYIGFYKDISREAVEYMRGMGILYERADKDYVGSDSIRKVNGDVASTPEKTSDWKRYYQELGLDCIEGRIINLSQEFNLNTKEKTICDLLINSYKLLSKYTHPSVISKVEYIEFPISHLESDNNIINPVLMPNKYGGEEGIYLNGYIDMVGRDINGDLVIIDHKTSAEEIKAVHVGFNIQLLAYSWALEKILNEKVKIIGINNIRAGTQALAYVPEEEERDKLLNTLFNRHILITNKVFSKHLPEINSPCLNMYGNPCPYLHTCWKGNSF